MRTAVRSRRSGPSRSRRAARRRWTSPSPPGSLPSRSPHRPTVRLTVRKLVRPTARLTARTPVRPTDRTLAHLTGRKLARPTARLTGRPTARLTDRAPPRRAEGSEVNAGAARGLSHPAAGFYVDSLPQRL